MIPLEGVFGRKTILGVDIGTVSIKAVEIAGGGGSFQLINYGIAESGEYLERSNSVIQSSSFRVDETSASEMLSFLIGKTGIKTRDVVAAIPAFAVFTSVIEMPFMSSAEIAQAIPYQARSLVPLPISDVTIDWMAIGQFEDEKGVKKQQIFMVSVPNDVIKTYQVIFKRAGLNLKMLEIEGMSVARSISAAGDGNVMTIDMGALSTSITVVSNGSLKYSTQTDFAGISLTQALVKGLGISPKRAELLKRQRGLSGMSGEYGLSTLMQPFLDVIIGEAKRVRDIFERKYGQKIERIALLGGGAELHGVDQYMTNQIGLPAVRGNGLSGISYPTIVAPLAPWIGSRFPVAIGAALKAFV